MRPARLIALDWGTSRLRACLLDSGGSIIERIESDDGLQRIVDGRWREVFERVCAGWLESAPNLPVIASGMVGSRQGWCEAPYVAAPAGFDDIAAALLRIDALAGCRFAIVPGVSTRSPDGLHDVVRGEETQVLGALAGADGDADRMFVLPGTHSKWLRTRDRRIDGFRTYLTGELFELLSRHSTIGRLFTAKAAGQDGPQAAAATPQRGAADDAAFDDGLQLARADPAGITALMFSVRAEGLFGRYDGERLPAFLSGILIGAELAHATTGVTSPVTIIGGSGLAARYARAITRFGLQPRIADGDPAMTGLFALARFGGLLD